MYYVTAQHGAVFPHEIECLWSTVANNKRNIIPILDYVISKGLTDCDQVQYVQILCNHWHALLACLDLTVDNACFAVLRDLGMRL